MENGLYFTLIQNHIFVGKALKEFPDILVDVIEFIPMINQAGGINLQAVILGELTMPEERVIIKLSKESPYWVAYYKASLKISNA